MTQITVVKRGDKWLAMFPWSHETKDRVKNAGFRFDPARKEWWTSDSSVASSFGADMKALNGHAAPKALNITAPNGLEYLPFQKAGIAEMTRRPNVLLADQMGLGKTIQAIGLINARPDIKRVLIICPASLKINWKNELFTWCERPMTILVLSSGDDWQPCDIVILNYEQVAKYRNAIDRVAWDLLICDESHYLKNTKAQRTQAIIGKWDNDPAKRVAPINARQKLWMTGTPILNRPKELWTAVRTLDRGGLGRDWLNFHTRYCEGYKDHLGYWQTDGAGHLEELQEKLRSGIMVRRLKADVLRELPAKRRQVILLQAETLAARHALKAEQELNETETRMARLRQSIEALSADKANADYKKAVQELGRFEGVAFTETAGVRHQTALAKLPMAMDHLINVLENEDKIVVFAYHHDVIDGLAEGLKEYGVVTIDGRVSTPDREKARQAFQTDPGRRIIIGSIGAMGVGWTLTEASYVSFVELDWVPGNLAQAEDRLHRIGQTKSVLVQHLMLENSFDARMAQSVISKMDVIERAVG